MPSGRNVVTSRARVWIEICSTDNTHLRSNVTPRVRVWIEILENLPKLQYLAGRFSCGSMFSYSDRSQR